MTIGSDLVRFEHILCLSKIEGTVITELAENERKRILSTFYLQEVIYNYRLVSFYGVSNVIFENGSD